MQWINCRREGQLELAAVHAAWIMNCWASEGHRITAEALLGRQDTRVNASDFESVEAFQEYLREHGKG